MKCELMIDGTFHVASASHEIDRLLFLSLGGVQESALRVDVPTLTLSSEKSSNDGSSSDTEVSLLWAAFILWVLIVD